ncbi:MAG: 2-C-methyl-D-erythritol 2,4-cyclodiphosphate synthase [Candidatus Glassbacteria bacterium]|nr:2-C-methyl-D-erythritol 2,4-cyclodiphosphate synthase [Candidatus Glassbacteria bacterium]
MSKSKAKKLPPCAAVIAAGGRGLRMGGDIRKQFIRIGGASILQHSFRPFLALPEVVRIVVALPGDTLENFSPELNERERGIVHLAEGGETRQQSVYNALATLEDSGAKLVAIHDAARPLVNPELVRRTFEVADEFGCAMLCASMRDTVKRGEGGVVAGTLDRENLWLAQTPQTFRLKLILDAHRRARREGVEATDDAALCERFGHEVRIVPGDHGNIKLTAEADLDFVRWKLEGPMTGLPFRIGEGYDLHRLERGRRLIIGGVEIPYEFGLAGHSDADVLLHAITDALLGAAAAGDIGRLFPDDDPEYKDADSAVLLRRAAAKVAALGWIPVNLDATVIAQRPRLAPHMEKIRARIAGILEMDLAAVNVKAKTNEGVGPVGREEAVAARAVVLVGGEAKDS